jgi:hypothetical protein
VMSFVLRPCLLCLVWSLLACFRNHYHFSCLKQNTTKIEKTAGNIVNHC